MARKLFELHVYCGRMGDLIGRFVLDDEEQAKLETLYGKEIRFGEVLGKHSDVVIELKPEHIKVITDDQDFLDMADKIGVSLYTGFNPLDYVDEG